MVSMEERPSDMLFQQHGSERLRIFTLQFGPSWTEYFLVNGLKEVALSLGHLVFSSLHHLIPFSWGTQKMRCMLHHYTPLCRNLLAGYELLQLVTPAKLQMLRMNSTRDKICVGKLEFPH